MLGTNFVYVLMRTDRKCYKIGHTTNLRKRLRSLNRHFGPFSSEHSYAFRTRTKYQARKLEDALRTLLRLYSFTLPVGDKPNGQTEWFTGRSFDLLLTHRESILAASLGNQQPDRIDVESIAPLSSKDILRLEGVRKAIKRIEPQLTAKWENAERTKEFVAWISRHRNTFLGIDKCDKEDGKMHFELFLKRGACSREELIRVSALAHMQSNNRKVLALTNFHTLVESTPSYQKIEFVFSPSRRIHEDSWESAGYTDEMYSILDDLCQEQPLPYAYRQYVGVSIFDNLTAEQIALALRGSLLGAPPP